MVMKSKSYIIVYLLVLASCFYPVLDLQTSIIDGVFFRGLDVLLSPAFYFLLLAVCVSTFIIIKEYNESKFVIMRFKTKEKYIEELIKIIIIVNTIIIIVTFLLIFLIIWSFCLFELRNRAYHYYGITFRTYYLFYMIKSYFLIQCISIISVLLSQLTNKIISTALYLYICMSYFSGAYTEIGVISSFNKFRISIVDYFNIYQYSSFELEILYTSIYILILVIIINILYEILKRKHIEIKL